MFYVSQSYCSLILTKNLVEAELTFANTHNTSRIRQFQGNCLVLPSQLKCCSVRDYVRLSASNISAWKQIITSCPNCPELFLSTGKSSLFRISKIAATLYCLHYTISQDLIEESRKSCYPCDLANDPAIMTETQGLWR